MNTLDEHRAIIGTIIAEPAAYIDASHLKASDFPGHLRPLWEIIVSLEEQGNLTTDNLIVALRDRRLMEGLGEENIRGEDYFIHLLSYAHGFEAAVEKVLELGLKAELLDCAALLMMEARDGKPACQIIDEMTERLWRTRRVGADELQFVGNIAPGFHNKMVRLRAGEPIGAWTPKIPGVGEITDYVEGELIIVGGEYAQGKSSILRYDAIKTAMEYEPVISFHGEKNLAVRYAIAYMSGLNARKLKHPELLTEVEWAQYNEAYEKFVTLPWVIEPLITKEIMFKARQMQHKYGLRLVQVDQIQNMMPNQDVATIDKITYLLRDIAEQLDVPLEAAHQQNRPTEFTGGKKPDANRLLLGGQRAAMQVWTIWHQKMTPLEAAVFPDNIDNNGLLLQEERYRVIPININVAKNTAGEPGVTGEIAWYRHLNRYEALPRGWRNTGQKLAVPAAPALTWQPAPKPVKRETNKQRHYNR